jgi:ADP-ribose pyrophosphatase
MASDDRTVTGLVIDGDELVGTGGFLALRRMRLRNRRADGSLSAPYVCDFVVRPAGLDAVVVVIYRRDPGGTVHVLLRDGLRPAVYFGRTAARPPVPEDPPALMLTELCAGIVEEPDQGEAGVRARAAAEAFEEAGYRVRPDDIRLLGAATFPSPGAMPEKFFLAAVKLSDEAAQEPLAGDGSPMEEGASTRWMELEAAIEACVAGALCDAKTELGLRRLRDALG